MSASSRITGSPTSIQVTMCALVERRPGAGHKSARGTTSMLHLPHDNSHSPLIIGDHDGASFALPEEARRQHLHVIGATGSGKSTLLLNLIAQDVAAGRGLALLDPLGGIAEAALPLIP